ncbi:GGDEF domain-containing protein [Thaumasiovibrio subtropicus]|uniref:GGDEF domain-containing protein n=1 Tax=Thaumasiovibrio subtropicus TaxID=1891207 RepID=UPI000B360124|nr:sensor domain-containing diguanylate cyclase [Thaumasiovibrio subtropicus]
MQIPDKPENEESRLASLRGLKVLDTEPEERYDRITRLARRLFNVPIALVSLVDENRQWFKSCFGLDVTETPRDISFCGHAILDNKPFIIEDAREDSRFADNPLVTGPPHIRFYAGIPLVHEDGEKLGTLCIIDSEPHTLSCEEIEDLIDLAKMAERELAASKNAALDELTQISNRRGFMALASKSITYCKVAQYPFSVAFLDINDFKPINDKFGHQEGDFALQTFANLMRVSFRESDVFARIGGDEFVIFMSGASRNVAQVALNRFRESVKSFNKEANRGYDLCFSEGIASAKPNEDVSLEAMLEEADKAMYKHKQRFKTA